MCLIFINSDNWYTATQLIKKIDTLDAPNST